MADMDPLAVLALAQLTIIVIMALGFGAWVWHRGRLLSQAEYRECQLQQLVGQLERRAQRRDTADRLEEMTNAEAIADFDHHDPAVFDDTGEG